MSKKRLLAPVLARGTLTEMPPSTIVRANPTARDHEPPPCTWDPFGETGRQGGQRPLARRARGRDWALRCRHSRGSPSPLRGGVGGGGTKSAAPKIEYSCTA